MMKKQSILVLLLLTTQFSYGADCLRGVGKNAILVSKKSCNIIVHDNSKKDVLSASACFGSYIQNSKKFYVLNSDITINSRFSPIESIIVTESSDKVKLSSDKIQINKITASPELFKRYSYDISYNNQKNTLRIKKASGLFNLTQKFDLELECN